jgi:DNA anti-recombination protein RmuC
MLTQEDISHQQELLNIYRTNLKHLLLQVARYGGEVVSPLPVINDINQTRDNISRIKELLRSNGVSVDDHPDDISSIGKTLEEAINKQSSQVNKNDQSQVLRRAQHAKSVLQGAQILWVDDNPSNNIYERRLLRSLGVFIDLARSTDEALEMLQDTYYDVVISDMGRQGVKGEALRLLSEMKKRGINRSIIFYTWGVDYSQGTPAYAFAITERPDYLLNYIIDVLERERI